MSPAPTHKVAVPVAALATMASVLLLGVSCACAVGSNHAPREAASSHRDGAAAISVHTPTGWHLLIEADGSGQVGFGSLFQDTARFPAGTFDFEQTRITLLSVSKPKGSIATDLAIAVHSRGDVTSEARYLSDLGVARGLFATAVEAAETASTRVEQLYEKTSPIPDERSSGRANRQPGAP